MERMTDTNSKPEIDAQLTYRYTGFVTFTGGVALFFPGAAYGTDAKKTLDKLFD